MPDTIDVTKLNDHELLLVLHTKFDVMREDMKEVRDGTALKLAELSLMVSELEKHKASKVDAAKTDERVERIQSRQNLMVGGLIVVNILIPFIFNYLSKH